MSTNFLRRDKLYKGSIAIGVLGRQTNRPLGMIFTPEKMLDHEFVDYTTGRKRRIYKEIPVAVRSLATDAVKI